MKTNRQIRPARWALAMAIASLAMAATPAWSAAPARNASAAPARQPKVGLAGALADDERVIGEIAMRDELSGLRDHMFNKLNLSEEERAAFLAVKAVNELTKDSLTPRQRVALIKNVVAGIDKVLAVVKDPVKLMNINNNLVELGTKRLLNIAEYWPESPATQAQLRPVAEAVNKVYEQAAKLAAASAKDIEGRINNANQAQLGPQWERMENMTHMAIFSRGMNLLTVAMSIDKADPNREKIAKEGIEILKQYEDGFQLDAVAKMGIGKLSMVGGPGTIANAKKKFAEVIALPDAQWKDKFEAMYFTSVADVYEKKLPAAKQSKAAMEKWLEANPFQGPRQGIDAAVDMLEYRIRSAEADAAPAGPDREQAKAGAMEVLVKLEKDQPHIRWIIREQMVAQLPANPDVKALNPLLLGALVSRGEAEVLKPETAPVDDKALAQGVLAAREVLARAGQEGVTAEQLETTHLLLGLMYRRQAGMHIPSATTLMDFVEKHPKSANLRFAFDNAASQLGHALKESAGQPATTAAYDRFLSIATAPPFNEVRFNLEYAQSLVKKVMAAREGEFAPDDQRVAVANLHKAAKLSQAIADPAKLLAGRYTEMMAYDQLLEIDSNNSSQYMPRATALADAINKLAAAPPAGQENDAKLYKVRTNILAANLAKHVQGAEKKKSMEKALELLATFEKDAEGLPNSADMVGNVRYIRVNYLMQLGRAAEALDDLAKYVETSGDAGISVIYEMQKKLNEEFDAALKNDRARAVEIAGYRAQVSKTATDTVSKSKNAATVKLLPEYQKFEAQAALRAAELETDAAKRGQYLQQALKFYDDALAKDAENRDAQFNVALIQFELGNYEKAHPLLAALVNNKQLGKPIDVIVGPAGQQTKWNDVYWNGHLKLIQCIVKLVEQKKPNFGAKELEDAKNYLKRLFIQWGEPGGPKHYPEFKKLKDQLLPGWTPPTDAAPATQPAGK